MERFEELAYLSGLCLEASAWRLSEGDERDPLRIEVESRIKKLTESPDSTQDPPEIEVNLPEEVVQAMEADRLNEHLGYKDSHVRIRENGKAIWIYREDAVKVMDGPKKFHWERRKE